MATPSSSREDVPGTERSQDQPPSHISTPTHAPPSTPTPRFRKFNTSISTSRISEQCSQLHRFHAQSYDSRPSLPPRQPPPSSAPSPPPHQRWPKATPAPRSHGVSSLSAYLLLTSHLPDLEHRDLHHPPSGSWILSQSGPDCGTSMYDVMIANSATTEKTNSSAARPQMRRCISGNWRWRSKSHAVTRWIWC